MKIKKLLEFLDGRGLIITDGELINKALKEYGIKEIDISEVYKIKVKCTNCEYENHNQEKLEIKIGQSVSTELCPSCQTLSLEKKDR